MFSGSIVALVTPMDSEGAIDFSSLEKLIDYHVVNGTSAIVSTGTTGESATLTKDESIEIILKTLEFADGRIPVIASINANSTSEAVSFTNSLSNTGVIGYLIVTPYYNKPTQEGLYQHFKKIAESSTLPQILYNVPSRTGCDLLPMTISRLAKIKNIVAIKEASGNLSRVSQIEQEVNNNNFILLSGDDQSSLDFMVLGGRGVISVTANVAAREMAQLCTLVQQGNFSKAKRLNQYLMPLHQALCIETNPIPVKWACKILELLSTHTLRLPMTPLSESFRPSVERALKIASLL